MKLITLAACVTLCLLPLASTESHAKPATQACLGDIDKLLTCEAPNQLVDLRRQDGGSAFCAAKNSIHTFPTNTRNGPSIWRYYKTKGKLIRRAGLYKDHKKTGRHYYFDRQGRLERVVGYGDDDYDGYSVSCHPNGTVQSLMPYTKGDIDGIVRRWTDDGRTKYMTRYVKDKRVGRVDDPKLQMAPPNDLCRPKVCDLYAPVRSGF